MDQAGRPESIKARWRILMMTALKKREIQWKSVRLQELMESVCVKARRMSAKEGVVTL
jgi:hypothetical protein